MIAHRQGALENGGGNIEFVGSVPVAMRHLVECLFFFNPRQELLVGRIRATVEETGAPYVIEVDGRVWIGVPSGAMQCLFACARGGEPVGVVLYCRPTLDCLWICHLALNSEWVPAGSNDGCGLAMIMVDKIREIARSIKGVTRIQLPYRQSSFLNV